MLQITELTYRIGGRPLLEGATLVLADGARAGLVGRNGCGKTTLFRLILGELSPESGTISMPRGTRIGHVAQEAPDGPERLIDFVLAADRERATLMAEAETAREPHRIAEIQTRLADIDAHSAEARAARILAGLGFNEEAQKHPCHTFSGGWRMRIALAAILFSAPDLLLLDEPTNYLDLEGAMWLQSYLARYPHTVLVISHDRDMLNMAVDTIVHLDGAKLTSYRGGYDQFERQRRERLELVHRQKKKQEEQRRHLQAFVDRFRHKATKARQAQSRLKALARMQPIEALVTDRVKPFRFPAPKKPASPPLLQLEDVAVGYVPGKPVLSRMNLRIDPDDRIGLLGANGNGKSTFARLVAGRLDAEAGRIMRADKIEIAYFAQHQLDELDPRQSPFEAVRERLAKAREPEIRARIDQMGLASEKMDTPAGSLSGGERARLLIGLATLRGPHLLILDEPTNHLDIDAREALVQALADFPGAVMLISHDRHLIETSADRLWLVAGGTVRAFDGDIDDYRGLVLQRPQERRAEASGGAVRRKAVTRRRVAAERRRELAPLKRRIERVEAEIARLDALIGELDVRLADPALFPSNPAEGARLSRKRAEAERALHAAEEEWLTASSAYEEGLGDPDAA